MNESSMLTSSFITSSAKMFNFKDKDQKLTGFEVELGAALAQAQDDAMVPIAIPAQPQAIEAVLRDGSARARAVSDSIDSLTVSQEPLTRKLESEARGRDARVPPPPELPRSPRAGSVRVEHIPGGEGR